MGRSGGRAAVAAANMLEARLECSQMALQRGDRVYIRGHLEGVALGSRLARIVRGGFSIGSQRYVYAKLEQPVTTIENGVELRVETLPIAEEALELVTPLHVEAAVPRKPGRHKVREVVLPPPEAVSSAPPPDCSCGHSPAAHGRLTSLRCAFCFCSGYRAPVAPPPATAAPKTNA